MQFTNGTYHLQGVSFQELANQFGTPLYVYDAAKITQQIQSLKTAFAEADVKIKYAAKALTNISILTFMRQNGVGVDVVSIQEAQLALRAGYRAQEIMF
ncbi:MAG: diaminopimelate decarboxylase, partial [Cyclobacteriaceae bacterium]|nr:diaminopimelate decarboxylase [Cyclobacteriaceae bacterium]